MKDDQDALGHALYDRLMGKGGFEIIERDDGFFDAMGGPSPYFSEYERLWPERQKRALDLATGRVLDIGCGAGRHALYLQEKGLDVLGIDNSPLAIEICKLRGLRQAALTSIGRLSAKMGRFDTLIMFGNNFGLLGGRERGRQLLKRLQTTASSNGRILAESLDPYATEEPLHLAYHERNRRRGRMAGRLRLRVRYKTYATPWFDHLMASREEIQDILMGTGWRIAQFIEDGGPQYVAVIEKAAE